MNKAAFLDRDDTINIDYGYVGSPDKFDFIPGAIEGLKKLNEMGYLLIVISNQSGIARGYYTKEDADKTFDYMVNELAKNGVTISKYYYCSHVDEDNCNCRKPKTALFEQAVKDFDLSLDDCIAIGDKERDLCICENTNVKGFLLSNKENEKYITKKSINEVADSLKEAIKE